MRTILNLFVLGLSIQSQAQTLPTHILEKPVLSLSRVAGELKTLEGKVSDPQLQIEVKDLQTQVSAILKKSLLAPTRGSNGKLNEAGFELAIIGSDLLNYRYEVKESPFYARLRREAFDFRSERWEQIRPLVANDQQSTRSVMALLSKSEVQAAMTRVDKSETAFLGGQSRLNALNKIQEQVDLTLQCIDYFPRAFRTTGLNPVANGDDYTWSVSELKKKYGVDSINDLRSSDKKEVKKQIDEYISAYLDFGANCIDVNKAAFFETERNRLKE